MDPSSLSLFKYEAELVRINATHEQQRNQVIAKFTTLRSQQLSAITRQRNKQGLPKLNRDQLVSMNLATLEQQKYDQTQKAAEDFKQAASTELDAHKVGLADSIQQQPSAQQQATIISAGNKYGLGGKRLRALNDRIRNQMPAPTTLYYAQATFIINAKNGPLLRTDYLIQKGVTLITPDNINDYILNTIKNTLTYEYLSTLQDFQIIDIKIHTFDIKRQPNTISVRKVKQGNCVISILANSLKPEVHAKIFKALPHLQPTPADPNPEITPNDLAIIAKKTKTKINVYTRLAAKCGLPPWQTFGNPDRNYKTIDMQFSNGHANIVGKQHIDELVYWDSLEVADQFYHDVDVAHLNFTKNRIATYLDFINPAIRQQLADNPDDQELLQKKHDDDMHARGIACEQIHSIDQSGLVDVIDYGFHKSMDGEQETLHLTYYVRAIGGKNYMHKRFRPSKFTNNPEDDTNHTYLYANSREQMLTIDFKNKYDLKPIKDDFIREVVKRSEHFICRKIFEKIPKAAANGAAPSGGAEPPKQLDCNKCYVSAKFNPEYMGFPSHRLYPTLGMHDTALFVVCTIPNPPKAFQMLAQYTPGAEIALARPTYNALLKLGATPQVTLSLIGLDATQDIDIVAFADANYGPESTPAKKLFANALLGRLISGGMQETRKITIPFTDNLERDQIIFECDSHEPKMKFSVDNILSTITVYYYEKPTGIFHFHSYILSYAMVTMMNQLHAMMSQQPPLEIVGYNVDAILYRGVCKGFPKAAYGGFKNEPLKPYYSKLLVAARDEVPEPKPPLQVPKYVQALPQNTLTIGAAGISKSYSYLQNPLYDMIIATPTHELKYDHRNTIEEVQAHLPASQRTQVNTLAKIYQPSMSIDKWQSLRQRGTIPRAYRTILIDEAFMFDSKQWVIVLERAKMDRTIIVTLGDDCQIKTAHNSDPVTVDFFEANGFAINRVHRNKDKICRQIYEEGIILDRLRYAGEDDPDYSDYEISQLQVALLRPHVASVQNSKITFEAGCTQVVGPRGTALDLHTFPKLTRLHITDNHWRCHELNLRAREYCMQTRTLIRVREINPNKNAKQEEIFTHAGSALIWYDRVRMTDVPPSKYEYEPAYAITSDSVQGRSLDCQIYIDENISRLGAFYTAATRCRKLSQVVIVTDIVETARPARPAAEVAAPAADGAPVVPETAPAPKLVIDRSLKVFFGLQNAPWVQA